MNSMSTRFSRALLARGPLALTLLCALVAAADDQPAARPIHGSYRQVRQFDFEERPLGNYGREPMHWERFTGPGLPFYSSGRFDLDVGHNAAPSFRVDLRGGSVGYGYMRDDIMVSPQSDYLVEAYVRAAGLEHARAMMVCYLVDRLGVRIDGTEQVSALVRSLPQRDEWQRVAIEVQVEDEHAYALRLELWVLQDHVWSTPPAEVVDPIIREEVGATVWFDDVVVWRLPRVRLALSTLGSVVRADEPAQFLVDVNNATLAALQTRLIVEDADGLLTQDARQVPSATALRLEFPVPALPPGLYTVRVQLESDTELLLRRQIRFVVLPAADDDILPAAELGVDIGPWAGGDPDAARVLINGLHVGNAKIGVTMIGPPDNAHEQAYLQQIRQLARELVLSHVEPTGVVLPPTSSDDTRPTPTAYEMVHADDTWEDAVGPVFADLADLVLSWQLGMESTELAHPERWSAAGLARVRTQLERLVAVPQLVVPRSVLDAAPAGLLGDFTNDVQAEAQLERWLGAGPTPEDIARRERAQVRELERPYAYAFWLPAEVPTESIPWYLAFWREPFTDQMFEGAGATVRGNGAHWLSLERAADPTETPAQRIANLARRFILAKAINPDRLYVAAPFELSTWGGAPQWQPTDEYIPLRTLARHLGGLTGTTALRIGDNAVGVLFADAARCTLAVWTWGPEAADNQPLCVGPDAVGVELNGTLRPLESDGVRAQIPLEPTPLLIENVDPALLLLADSFEVQPNFVQLHLPQAQPVLRLRNDFGTTLTGTLTLQPPAEWQVEPNELPFSVEPGAWLEVPLRFTIPPRQLAGERPLHVELHLLTPRAMNVPFEAPIQVGLDGIEVHSVARWEGDTLVIDQTLRNRTAVPVSFSAFCELPRRAQQENLFMDVAPGATVTQTYRFGHARDVAGGQAWLGIQEVNGPRRLDQLVVLPL